MENNLLEQIKDKLNRFRYLHHITKEDIKKFQKNHPDHFNVTAKHLGAESSLSDEEYQEYLELEELLWRIRGLIINEIK